MVAQGMTCPDAFYREPWDAVAPLYERRVGEPSGLPRGRAAPPNTNAGPRSGALVLPGASHGELLVKPKLAPEGRNVMESAGLIRGPKTTLPGKV
jgi:hypothetical protein